MCVCTVCDAHSILHVGRLSDIKLPTHSRLQAADKAVQMLGSGSLWDLQVEVSELRCVLCDILLLCEIAKTVSGLAHVADWGNLLGEGSLERGPGNDGSGTILSLTQV